MQTRQTQHLIRYAVLVEIPICRHVTIIIHIPGSSARPRPPPPAPSSPSAPAAGWPPTSLGRRRKVEMSRTANELRDGSNFFSRNACDNEKTTPSVRQHPSYRRLPSTYTRAELYQHPSYRRLPSTYTRAGLYQHPCTTSVTCWLVC